MKRNNKHKSFSHAPLTTPLFWISASMLACTGLAGCDDDDNDAQTTDATQDASLNNQDGSQTDANSDASTDGSTTDAGNNDAGDGETEEDSSTDGSTEDGAVEEDGGDSEVEADAEEIPVVACPPEDTLDTNDPDFVSTTPITPGQAAFDFSGVSSTGYTESNIGTMTVSSTGDPGNRTFSMHTTAQLRIPRSGGTMDQYRTIDEKSLHTETSSTLFDALFALAIHEAEEDSTDALYNDDFNDGAGFDCGGCYNTGRDWGYAWTRDSAFSIDLGLAFLDPTRSRKTLEFKLAERREGGNEQVVQDTGSGGSWPVSTDRVSWFLGARELIKWLDGSERENFVSRVLNAAKNTLEQDRATVYDAEDGLYGGEESFMDWRNQTYASWVLPNTVPIATSKSLSTNMLHLNAIRLAAELSHEKGQTEDETKYNQWADDLRTKIRAHFMQDEGNLSSLIMTPFDTVPTSQHDALAITFAVKLGLVNYTAASNAIAAYPMIGRGVPTIYPQQQAVAIYHNRSTWPFVTGYFTDAARKVGNDRVVEFGVWSLIRGAALNLSNMENLELTKGVPWYEDSDPSMSGPVINSARQLWSVAGYLSMVVHTLFGVDAESEALTISPFIPVSVRKALFKDDQSITLKGLKYRGKTFNIKVYFPANDTQTEGAYRVGKMTINGDAMMSTRIALEDMRAVNEIKVYLADCATASAQWNYMPDSKFNGDPGWQYLFAPKTPWIAELNDVSGGIQIKIGSEENPSSVTHMLYRNGDKIADLTNGNMEWTDTGADKSISNCYTVETKFNVSGTLSQHAQPKCLWDDATTHQTKIQHLYASDLSYDETNGKRVTDGNPVYIDSKDGQTSWGFVEGSFTAEYDGEHFIQAVFSNGMAGVDTGITCAVKYAKITNASGNTVADGYLIMPHQGREDWNTYVESSPIRANLVKGQTYTVRIGDDDETPTKAINMSIFNHFSTYSGRGGKEGYRNIVHLSEIKILPR